ncbi:hypothetical protein FEDK69T_14400 [Flavobacterium enshiense DK69]|uniref:TonB-dependent receptor n=1 Tax=Flavobacterium enshiense DK69 TaxID=1107311 RepID=V6SA23_9FLAO|nr:hypothetical protein [Flavobacterium enshiense]ESU23284.1 hypothetical protein FEDK69T_14400 [Flavobacterium enshiense DK69]KGO96485.1 hypothetical protein Q767_06160 [Flavobacterium enshiense DK69]
MKNKLLFLVSFLIVTVCSAQDAKLLNGKVVADVNDLQGVNVVNRASGKEVATSEDGLFSIYAKPGDTLVFTSVQLNEKRIVIEKEDFDYLPFVVKMRLKVTQLKEVVITDSGINAVSLGIVPKGMKTYTPAERRLQTAGDFKAIHLLGILGGSLPVDPIINKINGRTDRIKKEIKVERSEMLQQKLSTLFDETYFIEELKIPTSQVNGFFVFAAENQELANLVTENKKPLIELELVKLASEYLKRLSDEK